MIALLLGGWRDFFRTFLAAIDAIVASRMSAAPAGGTRRAVRALLFTTLALVLSWFLYVPLHELLHVAGCLATGGSVTRLTLSPLYGAAWLSWILPFVAIDREGAYAGRLTGFSTNGSDLCWLATDAAPYLLTILVGMPLLTRVARAPRMSGRAWLAGPACLLAAAPLIGLAGDYFEMGGILVTAGLDARHQALRSDDLFRLIGDLNGRESPAGVAAWIVVGASFACGALLAGWTWRLGALASRVIAGVREDASAPRSRSW